MITVYKLIGECYEITEESIVYSTKTMAANAIRDYEGFIGMTAEEALECDEVRIVEWKLK